MIEGQPKYLTVYEFERPDVPKSEAWNQVRDKNPWTHRIRPFMKLDAGSPAVFKGIYPDPFPSPVFQAGRRFISASRPVSAPRPLT